MSLWKAGSGGVTQSKRSGLTLYYYLNAGEESSAFQSIYVNFKQCFSSAIWELGEEEKSLPWGYQAWVNADTLKTTPSCLCLETKRFATWLQMHYIVLLMCLAYENSCLKEECLKLKWEYSACSLRAEISRELWWVTGKGRELIHLGAAEDCSTGTQGTGPGNRGGGRDKGSNLSGW